MKPESKTRAILRIGLLVALIVVIGVFVALQTQHTEKTAEISDAWVRSLLTSGSMTAAYCTISNRTDEDIVIVSAHAQHIGAIEFHESVYEDEMHRMVKLDELPVPAGTSLHLKPRGKHLMLFDVEPSDTSMYQIEFVLSDGATIVADFMVRDRTS